MSGPSLGGDEARPWRARIARALIVVGAGFLLLGAAAARPNQLPDSRRPRRLHRHVARRLFATIPLLMACALVAIAIAGLASSLRASDTASPTSRSFTLSNAFASLTDKPCGEGLVGKLIDLPCATLAIEPVALDSSKRQVTVLMDVLLGMPLRQLVDSCSGTKLGDFSNPDAPVPTRAFQSGYKKDVVIVELISRRPFAVTDIPVPLHELLTETADEVPIFFGQSVPQNSKLHSLPVTWDPEHYPNDSRTLDADAYVTLPKGVATQKQPPDTCRQGENLPLDLVGRLSDGHQLGSQNVLLGAAANQDPTDVSVHLSVTRDRLTQVFTLAIAAVPVPLALVLFDVLFLSQEKRKASTESAGNAALPGKGERQTRELTSSADGDSIQSFLVGLGAVILTILPLRLVLVPTDLQDLTRVDLILGLELSVLMLMGVGKYFLFVIRQTVDRTDEK